MSVFLDKSTADALRGKMLGNALCDDERRSVAAVLAEYEKPVRERRLGMLDLIAYTGSRSQGLSTSQSDADVRVVTGLTGRDLLTFQDFGTLKMPNGDTVVMSMRHFLTSLRRGSATDFEMLGQRDCDYEYVGPFAKMLMDNVYKVLSVKYADSSYGFVRQHSVNVKRLSIQLQNDGGVDVTHEQLIDAFRAALDKAEEGVNVRMASNGIDGSVSFAGLGDFGVVVGSEGMPAGDLQNALDSVKGITKRYSKMLSGTAEQTKRRLDKTLCHMLRTLYTAIEVMEGNGLCTCRTDSERDLLMSVKNGEFTDGHGAIDDAYWRIYDKVLDRFEALRQREKDGKGVLGECDDEWLAQFEIEHNLTCIKQEQRVLRGEGGE